jgi:hypothetical protein
MQTVHRIEEIKYIDADTGEIKETIKYRVFYEHDPKNKQYRENRKYLLTLEENGYINPISFKWVKEQKND